MSDISYKKFSELAATTSLIAADVIPVVTTTGGNNSKQITYGSFAQTISSTLIGPFTTTITAVEPASAGKWNSTYTTVNANSAVWGTGGSTSGFTIFKQISSVESPNFDTHVHALSIISSKADVDVAVLSKGTGATLAQIPDDAPTGGAKRGQYATDWQKSRSSSTRIAAGDYSTVGGGKSNRSGDRYSTVGGGTTNTASGSSATIGGGNSNITNGVDATIGGGGSNTAWGGGATVGGGGSNMAGDVYSTVGGGYGNDATGAQSTVGGGFDNEASGVQSTICGGNDNTSSGYQSAIVGGYKNIASGDYSGIVGGNNNTTAGLSNTFIIGSNITAVSADYTYVNNISSQGTVAANNFKYSTNVAGTVSSGPIFIDAGAAQLHHVIYTAAANTDIRISNLYNYPGRDVKIHIFNRQGVARALTTKYVSDSPALTGSIPLTTGLAASAAGSPFTMALNGISTVWVANIGGNIVGSLT